MRNLIYSLFVLGSLASLAPSPLWAQAPQSPQSADTPKTNSSSNCYNAKPSNTIPPVNSLCPDSTATDRKSERDGDEAKSENHTFEIISTLIALSVAIFSGLLWWTTDKMWKETKRSGDIAKQAADAATSNAATADRSMKVLERSYISVDNWGITNFAAGSKPFAVYQTLNSGRVPATLLTQIHKHHIGLRVGDTPDFENPQSIASSIVRPASQLTSPVSWLEPLSEEQYNRVMTREWCVFIWGRISYTDPLTTAIHITTFGMKAVYQNHDEKGNTVWNFEMLANYLGMT